MNPSSGTHANANKVKIGFFSFTEITDPREHRSYNEWHQLDHMPEQFPLPGVAYGQRWVSTPACRARRAVSRPPLDPIHYVTLYLMTEPVEQTLQEFRALGARLHDLGRFHRHRKARLSGPFPLVRTAAAARVLVSAAAVPFRPHRGIYVTVAGGPRATLPVDEWCDRPGVAGAWAFGDGARTITVAWLDEEPLAVADRLAPVSPGGLVLAGPFETITPWEWDWFDDRPRP
jgi:hypothetical protein